MANGHKCCLVQKRKGKRATNAKRTFVRPSSRRGCRQGGHRSGRAEDRISDVGVDVRDDDFRLTENPLEEEAERGRIGEGDVDVETGRSKWAAAKGDGGGGGGNVHGGVCRGRSICCEKRGETICMVSLCWYF